MSNPQTTNQNSRARKWASRITIVGLSLLVMLATAAYMTVWMGNVQGEEINADTFQRRKFAYFQLPLIEIQVSGITRTDSTGDLEKYLIKQKIIKVTAPKTPADTTLRWDLINAHRLGKVYSRGEAEILGHYLEATDDEGDYVWLDWTEANLKLAKVVWPAVLQVSKQELYILVPDLLEMAASSSDPTDLQNQLDAHLSKEYLRIAKTQQELARHELAVELFSESLARAPREILALEGRAVSLAALGQEVEADEDLAQVRELKRL